MLVYWIDATSLQVNQRNPKPSLELLYLPLYYLHYATLVRELNIEWCGFKFVIITTHKLLNQNVNSGNAAHNNSNQQETQTDRHDRVWSYTWDLIETYKILTGKEDIDRDQLFQLTPNIHSTRGHQLKLFKKPCRINVQSSSSHKESWTVGTLFHPMLWNLLPSTRLRTDWMTTCREMDAYKALLFKSIIYK